MAGHSKWANIKRHKAKVDAQKGKLYTKLIREITVSAKLGGAESQSNPRLRIALDKAQEANMSKDVIERAIKRGAFGMAGEVVEEIRYEGYGPSGTAIMVDCMTNNRNRTVGEVRHAFSKHGGNLGTDGSVAYLFKKQGILNFSADTDEERLMELALEAGAEDVLKNDDLSFDVITAAEDFMNVKEALSRAGLRSEQADITMNAETKIAIDDLDAAEKIMNLMDALENLDDVQVVYSNADISERVLNQLE